MRLEPDRLVFRRDDGTEASVTPAEVLVLEQHGTRSRAGMGALIGLGIGLTAGAAIAALGPGSNTDGVFDSGRMNLGVALASGGLGALTGAGVGAFVREDRWSSVPGWDRRMAITTSEPVVGVQLTWRW